MIAWCRLCDREFGPDAEQVSNKRYRCKECDAADRALRYYFHPKPKKPKPVPIAKKQPRPIGTHGGRRHWGEAVPGSKLKESDIAVIRAAAAAGKPVRSIAKLFGITTTHVRGIVNRQRWKHVA